MQIDPLIHVIDRRTLAKIQGKVVKQVKRSAIHRFILSKSDKDKIAAWKQDLIRVLHVFNVGSIGAVGQSKTQRFLSDRVGN